MKNITIIILMLIFACKVNANEFLENYVLVEEKKSVSEKVDDMKSENINYENITTKDNQANVVKENMEMNSLKTLNQEEVVNNLKNEIINIQNNDIEELSTVFKSENKLNNNAEVLNEKPVENIINNVYNDFEIDSKNNNVEPIVIDEVDILLNETTETLSNETIKEEVDSKLNIEYNNMILEKIKDLERRVSELEKIKSPEEI